MLSALNLAGAHGALLSSLVLAVAEVAGARRASAEQGFTMVLPSHLTLAKAGGDLSSKKGEDSHITSPHCTSAAPPSA
jgi:hypothetical protein